MKVNHKEILYVPRVILTPEFSTIQIMDISNNKIIELEGRVFLALRNLKTLSATNNEIKYISSKISSASSLQYLYLDYN